MRIVHKEPGPVNPLQQVYPGDVPVWIDMYRVPLKSVVQLCDRAVPGLHDIRVSEVPDCNDLLEYMRRPVHVWTDYIV